VPPRPAWHMRVKSQRLTSSRARCCAPAIQRSAATILFVPTSPSALSAARLERSDSRRAIRLSGRGQCTDYVSARLHAARSERGLPVGWRTRRAACCSPTVNTAGGPSGNRAAAFRSAGAGAVLPESRSWPPAPNVAAGNGDSVCRRPRRGVEAPPVRGHNRAITGTRNRAHCRIPDARAYPRRHMSSGSSPDQALISAPTQKLVARGCQDRAADPGICDRYGWRLPQTRRSSRRQRIELSGALERDDRPLRRRFAAVPGLPAVRHRPPFEP